MSASVAAPPRATLLLLLKRCPHHSLDRRLVQADSCLDEIMASQGKLQELSKGGEQPGQRHVARQAREVLRTLEGFRGRV